jgi:hypothetical protein
MAKLPLMMKLAIKVVKIDSKIINETDFTTKEYHNVEEQL